MADRDYIEPTGYPFTFTANTQTSQTIDTKESNSCVVQVTGTFVGTITPEQSNDGTNWVAMTGQNATSNVGAVIQAITATGLTAFSTPARFMRFRTTAWTSGSAVVTPILRESDIEAILQVGGTVSVGTVTTNTGLGTGAPGGTTSRIRAAAAAGGDPTLLKATPGNVSDIILVNRAAAERFVKFYSKATAPASTDTPLFTIPLRAGQEIVMNLSTPIRFALGIGYRIVTGVADTDNTAATADDVHGFVTWA